jgi:hypothetical protein
MNLAAKISYLCTKAKTFSMLQMDNRITRPLRMRLGVISKNKQQFVHQRVTKPFDW